MKIFGFAVRVCRLPAPAARVLEIRIVVAIGGPRNWGHPGFGFGCTYMSLN